MLGEAASEKTVRRPAPPAEEPPAKKKKTVPPPEPVPRNKPPARAKKAPAPLGQPPSQKGSMYPPEAMDGGMMAPPRGYVDPANQPWGAYGYDAAPGAALPPGGDPYHPPPSAATSASASKAVPPPPLPHRTSATAEEVAFFDKVSAYINDKNLYHEFLKVLNLYTQDIVELHVLVSRARLFLKDSPELWAEFRDMVGWHDGMLYLNGRVEKGEWIVDHVPVEVYDSARPDLEHALTSGPCYRKLPPNVGCRLAPMQF
jgi:paired amphipathic helix protein Sin3a